MSRRHRAVPPPPRRPPATQNDDNVDDDNDEEEDVFSALSVRGGRRNKKAKPNPPLGSGGAVPVPAGPPMVAPAHESASSSSAVTTATTTASTQANAMSSTTSSMKRHHKEMSHGRKAKMDAMLQELLSEQEQQKQDEMDDLQDSFSSNKRSSRQRNKSKGSSSSSSSGRNAAYAPRKGSHVEPGEERLTTNIFVGNLAPTLTEEALTQLFRQFGELYSVKIMWPRTAEDRARQRLTGFVCFYHRTDAEDAMEACNDADPFRNGHRLMLRWGKSVLKSRQNEPPRQQSSTPSNNSQSALPLTTHRSTEYQALVGNAKPSSTSTGNTNTCAPLSRKSPPSKIQVTVPSDPRRANAISLVASFVAKDGADLEHRVLAQGLSSHSDLSFLTPTPTTSSGDRHTLLQEHIYYKWRVYAYSQGDGDYTWRTEPFVMVKSGCLWIPPPIDQEAARRHQEEERRSQEEEEQRRRPWLTKKRGAGHGKQRSQAQRPLTHEELKEFHSLTRDQLSTSREAIAQAMAFCFDKSSHSASEIADLLKELMLLPAHGAEPRIARLYLLSDVLFNSQQPGVRNAFYYRDAIQHMAPQVFKSLGDTANSGGRWTHNKMSKAVSSVLTAWTNWSVYNHTFLDELQARFEGKEITAQEEDQGDSERDNGEDDENARRRREAEEVAAQVASTVPRGGWEELDETEVTSTSCPLNPIKDTEGTQSNSGDETSGGPQTSETSRNNIAQIDQNDLVDGEPLHENGAGSSVRVQSTRLSTTNELGSQNNVDGRPSESGIVASDDNKGQEGLESDGPNCDSESLDGKPVDDDADGEPLEDNDTDGKPLEDDDADGEPLEDDDVDGEPL